MIFFFIYEFIMMKMYVLYIKDYEKVLINKITKTIKIQWNQYERDFLDM